MSAMGYQAGFSKGNLTFVYRHNTGFLFYMKAFSLKIVF